MNSLPKWDWSNVSDGTVREMMRQGEARLADLLAVSIAADQRATTLAGMFGALSAGLFAADATFLTIQKFDIAATVSVGIAALGNLIACLICTYASRPINFFVGGYEPSKLVQSASDEIWMLRYICEDIQKRIDEDVIALRESAALTTVGLAVAIISLILGIATFAAMHSPAA